MGAPRIERAPLGELPFPADALYGIQTERARQNFPISHLQPLAPFVGRSAGDPALKLESWVTEAKGREIFKLAGKDLDEARLAAARSDFRPIPLGVTVSSHLISKVRRFETANVLGLLPGSDPMKKGEAVG